MPSSLSRRRLLIASGTVSLVSATPAWASALPAPGRRLAALEHACQRRIGVWAVDTASGRVIAHNADEPFAFCSTVKVMLAGAVLHRAASDPSLLEHRITFGKAQLVSYSPVTEQHVGTGMTVAELCKAGLQYSDNTAANLLIDLLGGTAAVNAYARRLGDSQFRLDRYETALNTAIPDDPRDTTTPAAMGQSLQHLALGEALQPAHRERLQAWLTGNTTGAERIRAALPRGWAVGDKTGSGDYGTANDVGVIWPSGRAPWVLAVYTSSSDAQAAWRSDVIAEAARVVVQAWG